VRLGVLLLAAASAACRDSRAAAPPPAPPEPPKPEASAPPKPAPAPAPAPTSDTSSLVDHALPNGSVETCQLLSDFPFLPPDVTLDAHGFATSTTWYDTEDYAEVDKLCDLAIDDPDSDPDDPIGVCPKLQGTQPAIEIFDLAGTRWQNDPDDFVKSQCGHMKRKAPKIAKLKTTVYGREPEAGFLYFHFSRLLGDLAHVPPVTYRSILASRLIAEAKEGIRDLVALPDRRLKDALEGGFGQVEWVLKTDPDRADPRRMKRYSRVSVAGSPDLAWGALAQNPRGEMNHSTFSFIGDSPVTSTEGFRQTWFYKTLASDKPLSERNLKPQAMADLRDFEDLALLDGLFLQNDRNGNIHAEILIHKIDKQGHLRVGRHGKGLKLRRLLLRDNDDSLEWGSHPKMGFATLVRELRHMDPLVYGRVQWLAGLMRDPASDRAIEDWFANEVHVSRPTYQKVRERFLDLADFFAQRHAAGDLALDIDLAGAIASQE
jgi:hypothetical protein